MRERQRKISLAVLLCVAVIAAIAISFSMASTAEAGTAESSRYKYYTSIQVEPGSSLWDIAEKYASSEYESLEAYIREVRRINHLDGDTIYAGSYLCIPYYSSAYK
ncbi:MAG TPA: LysM peptidoglycan-binding domain-containing protein [Candidatus Blautia stercoripullorum]|uniref:LysM peptidoglycan-binding domain-containing protein n=1 Tax=Candidatus Blautia stercoripullorum TaxID=2838502 RepID=A0A9D2R9Z7_9FIRM|nr:LysM peptidoglycan-binding domain-containing protein [Candidatus Blautia stercoripullorum]